LKRGYFAYARKYLLPLYQVPTELWNSYPLRVQRL
jgi:hypothetical protein